jgi:hypothetical protein
MLEFAQSPLVVGAGERWPRATRARFLDAVALAHCAQLERARRFHPREPPI